MKRNFEEPCLELEHFDVCDQTMFLSGVDLGEDELDPAYGVAAYN